MKKTIDEFYSPEVLRELQLMEIDILKDFDMICKKYNLEYFGIFGTLLGAVRHHGIIPWDDDIDVGMPRKDFEKLQSIWEAELSDKYNFLNGTVESRYPFATARLMKKNTEFRMLSMKSCPFELGVFLDIFPYDNIPEDARLQKQLMDRCWILDKFNILRNTPFPNLPYRGITRIFAYMACFLGSLVIKLVPRTKLQSLSKKAGMKYSDQETEYIGYVYGLRPRTRIHAKSDIYPLQNVPFEDFSLPIPANADKILRQSFGDNYMTPPPKGKRSNIVPYRLDLGNGLIEENK